MTAWIVILFTMKNIKGLHTCKWKCYDCMFLCIGLITCIIIISWKRFLGRPLWYLVQWTLKMNNKLNLICGLMKLKIKWATKLRYHVFFATQRTGLHNQIVQDGISSLVNKFERWSVQMRIGKENLRVPFSSKDLSETRNAMSWVKTFQIAKV